MRYVWDIPDTVVLQMNLMKKRLTKKSFDLFDSIMKRKDPEVT